MSGYWEVVARAVGGWDLQETSGLIATDSVGAQDGTLLNGLDFAADSAPGPTGWLPSALSLSASNHGIQIPFDASLNGPYYTVHGWVKWDGGGTPYGTTWSCRSSTPVRSGHLLYKSNLDQWSHWFGEGGSGWKAYGTEPSSTEWVFLAVTFDGNTKRIYADGSLVSSYGASGYVANSVEPWMFGNRIDTAVAFRGDIAGYGIYDEALSASEVAELYAGPEPTNLTAPELLSPVAVGEPLTISSGQWDNHGNGAVEISHTVYVSDDGVAGWNPVTAPVGDPGIPLLPMMSGKYLKVEGVATSLGGPSDAASSVVYQVSAPQSPVRLAAGEIHSDCASLRRIAPKTAAAGLVIPMEDV